jgi:hypothetical protein
MKIECTIFWLKHIAKTLLSFIETAMKIKYTKFYLLKHVAIACSLAAPIETAMKIKYIKFFFAKAYSNSSLAAPIETAMKKNTAT